MNRSQQKTISFGSKYAKLFSFLAILLVALAIPGTVLISQQQQKSEQNASGFTSIPPGCFQQGMFIVCPISHTVPPTCRYIPLCRFNGSQCLIAERIGPCSAISGTPAPSGNLPPGCYYKYQYCARPCPINNPNCCPSLLVCPSGVPLPTSTSSGCYYKQIPCMRPCAVGDSNCCPSILICPTGTTISPTPATCAGIGGTCSTQACDPNTQTDYGPMDCDQSTESTCCVPNTLITPTPSGVTNGQQNPFLKLWQSFFPR